MKKIYFRQVLIFCFFFSGGMAWPDELSMGTSWHLFSLSEKTATYHAASGEYLAPFTMQTSYLAVDLQYHWHQRARNFQYFIFTQLPITNPEESSFTSLGLGVNFFINSRLPQQIDEQQASIIIQPMKRYYLGLHTSGSLVIYNTAAALKSATFLGAGIQGGVLFHWRGAWNGMAEGRITTAFGVKNSLWQIGSTIGATYSF